MFGLNLPIDTMQNLCGPGCFLKSDHGRLASAGCEIQKLWLEGVPLDCVLSKCFWTQKTLPSLNRDQTELRQTGLISSFRIVRLVPLAERRRERSVTRSLKTEVRPGWLPRSLQTPGAFASTIGGLCRVVCAFLISTLRFVRFCGKPRETKPSASSGPSNFPSGVAACATKPDAGGNPGLT